MQEQNFPYMMVGSASEWTPTKQEVLKLDLGGVYAPIAEAIQCRHSYVKDWFYADLTTGFPYSLWDGQRIEGSFLIALNSFQLRHRLKAHCVFIERDPVRIASLDAMLDHVHRDRNRIGCDILETDHRLFLDMQKLPDNCGPHGLLYWDGLGEDIFPAAELSRWLRKFTMHDLFVMISGTAPKRSGRERVDYLLGMMPKDRFLYLSKPQTKWHWIFALITGWQPLCRKFADYGLPLYRSDSREGKDILRGEAMTKVEFDNYQQPPLFDL